MERQASKFISFYGVIVMLRGYKVRIVKATICQETSKMYYFIEFLDFFIHILLFYPVIFAIVKIINNPK